MTDSLRWYFRWAAEAWGILQIYYRFPNEAGLPKGVKITLIVMGLRGLVWANPELDQV